MPSREGSRAALGDAAPTPARRTSARFDGRALVFFVCVPQGLLSCRPASKRLVPADPMVSTQASSITLRFYGVGGAFSRRYGTTCSGLTLRDRTHWLIDCGRQAPDQLHAADVAWHDIEGQIVTLVGADHTYGLEDFAFSRFFRSDRGVGAVRTGGPKPKLICHRAVRREVWETLESDLRYVPNPQAPTSGRLETYFEVLDPIHAEPPLPLGWSAAERFVAGGLRVVAHTSEYVPHKPSTSLEIAVGEHEGDDRIAWWSSIATVIPALLTRLAPRTTVFFHDCTFGPPRRFAHGSFEALAALPEALRRKIVLMNHDDDLEDHRARAESLGFRIALPGDVYDLVSGQRVS
jgi:hypothetical protein